MLIYNASDVVTILPRHRTFDVEILRHPADCTIVVVVLTFNQIIIIVKRSRFRSMAPPPAARSTDVFTAVIAAAVYDTHYPATTAGGAHLIIPREALDGEILHYPVGAFFVLLLDRGGVVGNDDKNALS